MLMVRPRLRHEQGAKSLLAKFLPHSAVIVEIANSGAIPHLPIPPFRPATGYNVASVIRDFEPEDFESLWRMDQACFPAGIAYSKQELKAYIRQRGAFTLVAVESLGGKAQGFIVAHRGPTGHIVTIDVDPAIRRSGVGSALLEAAEERLHAAGSHAVGLETAVDNVSALAFYKRQGYNVLRTWPRYYSNGVDALVLKKELNGESLPKK
jgi:ribosomal-protein-alanine N-acetyltransferase